jgi:hypothetical protein
MYTDVLDRHMHAHEKLLREECGYMGAQPYWDEAKEAGKFSKSKIFDPVYGFGGDGTGKGADGSGSGGCIETGRFASYTVGSFPRWKHSLSNRRLLNSSIPALHLTISSTASHVISVM